MSAELDLGEGRGVDPNLLYFLNDPSIVTRYVLNCFKIIKYNLYHVLHA